MTDRWSVEDPSECDHEWPGDLEPDVRCYRCGLPYAEWIID